MSGIERLIEVVSTLRGPDGCAWDRAQTLESLAPCLLEETHEVLEAIRSDNHDALRTELGDLFFVTFLLVQVLEETDGTSLDTIVSAAASKMSERHPHVFGGETVAPDWESQKLSTERERSSRLDGVPSTLPALHRAQRISARAATLGFDWPNVSGVRDKIDEELAELDEAQMGSRSQQMEEFGDLLFTMTNWGRKLNLSSEDALHRAIEKFERRFRHVEQALHATNPTEGPHPPELLNALWDQAKEAERKCYD